MAILSPDNGMLIGKTFLKPSTHLGAANYGIGGDKTENRLDRIADREVAHITPKLVVVKIGTNKFGVNTNDEIDRRIRAVIDLLLERLPLRRFYFWESFHEILHHALSVWQTLTIRSPNFMMVTASIVWVCWTALLPLRKSLMPNCILLTRSTCKKLVTRGGPITWTTYSLNSWVVKPKSFMSHEINLFCFVFHVISQVVCS